MRYAVPRRDREYASWPQITLLPALVESNIGVKRSHGFNVLDISVKEFRRLCVEECRAIGEAYAREIGVPCPSPESSPLIATGHQPELYHCGVWIKNHLASHLARAVGGSSLNLIVDNDVPKHAGLVMPFEEGGRWEQKEAAFAEALAQTAFEEHPPGLSQPRMFEGEVRRTAEGRPFEAEAVDAASRLISATGKGVSLGDVTTSVRLSYEREVGLANAELPVSRLSGGEAFGVFAASIVADLPVFAKAYNEALAGYRRSHGIRNKANPLPDLEISQDAVEAPFWVWRAGQPRGRLFAKRVGGGVALLAEGRQAGMLDVSSAAAAGRSWRSLVDSGLKIRPRALTTTIFMRMFVSDLFIHGIGGAKYDEVTDDIIRAFYGVEPPRYATISCSLMLEWPFEPADPAEAGALKQALRAIRYNPQRHLGDGDAPEDFKELVEEKWRLVDLKCRDRKARREKFNRIRRINDTLAATLEGLRRQTLERLEETRARLERDKVLFSREYCVFLVGARKAADFCNEVLAGLAVRSS